MANQPKKYKKFVATAATATLVASAIVPVASAASLSDIAGNTHEEHINALVDAKVINGYPDGTFKPNKTLTRSDVVKLLGKYLETQGYEPAANYKTSPAFTDLKTTSNEELLKYASVVKESGVFVGSNGNLKAGDPITRENMAIVLVRMANTLNEISLEEFVAAQDFDGDVKDLAQAKAEARSAISVLDYYDITNPTVANFNPKGETTRGQFATFLNKTINAEFSGAEQGASEVVPTAVSFEEKSTQGAFGETVTLKAKVSVAQGESAEKIPVTFAINPGVDELLQEQIKVEVLTDANGVATYSYTRYKNKTNNFTDTVIAYATAKQGVRDASAVYWGSTLKVTDVTEATTIANGEQKVYQVTGAANSYVYVTFKENLNVKPDTAVRTAYLQGTAYTQDAATDTTTIDTVGVVWRNPEDASQHTPYLLESGVYSSGYVRLDETGKANIVVTGKNAEVTPIVYSIPATTDSKKYTETALQATASKVKFAAESLFNLSVEAKGSQNAAYEYNAEQYGGRDYTVTLKGTDGKVMPNATVKVGFDEKAGTLYADQVSVYDADGEEVDANASGIYELTTDKDGQVTFTVTGTINNYATPIVFIGKSLTDYEIQNKSEIVYFGGVKASNYTSVLKVTNEELESNKEVSTFGNGETATFTYQLSDQNGKPRSYANASLSGNGSTTVTFTVRAGAKPVTVTTADGVEVELAAYATKSFTKTISSTATNTNIEVTGEGASEVRVTATPTNSGLSGLTSITQRVNFLAGASTSYFTVSNVSATATSIDSVTLTFNEAVTSNDIFVNVTGASVTANSASNNKVLYVYFNDAANKPAAKNGQFTIAYKGKTYVVTTDADGKLNVAARDAR